MRSHPIRASVPTLSLCVCALLLSACSLFEPQQDVGERSSYVVASPKVRSNRVMFLTDSAMGEGSRRYILASNSFDLDLKAADARRAQNGSPLSIIVNSAWLDIPEADRTKSHDIAVILNLETSQEQGVQQLAVWYQTDVPIGERLSFGDLLIHQTESWDEAKPVTIRLRVIDVTAERNIRTRLALNKVKELGGSVLLAAKNPLTAPLVNTAVDAAALVIAGKKNQALLDYTATFYAKAAGGTSQIELTPLLLGRVVVVGTDKMDQQLVFDQATGSMREWANKAPGAVLATPAVLMTVTDSELQVSPMVLQRSTYITNLINSASAGDVAEVEKQGNDFVASLKAFATYDSLRRYRRIGDLNSLITLLKAESTPPSVRLAFTRKLENITHCSDLSADGALDTLQSNLANDKVQIDQITGKLPDNANVCDAKAEG